VIQDRKSRFIVAHASGRRDEALATEAIRKAHARSRGQPVSSGAATAGEPIRRRLRARTADR
jgi:hypothetical protein